MGIIKEGIFGEVSGKVGPVIASRCFGVNYFKSKPLVYRDAKSESQKAVRKKFSKIGSLAISLLPTVIRPVWDKRVENLSGYNLFMKKNFKNVDPELSLTECEKLIISFGDLSLPENITVENSKTVPCGITITWTDNSGCFMASSNDMLRVVAICGDKVVPLNPANAFRSDCTADILLPLKKGQVVRVFVYFENALNNVFSDDVNFLVQL